MKVKELIEELRKYDLEMDVCYMDHVDAISYPNVDIIKLYYDEDLEKNVVLLIDDNIEG